MAYTEDQIIGIGGKPWAKGGKYRVYINDWADLAGLDITRYKTGNVSFFSIDGEEVANGRAMGIVNSVQQVYWDAVDGEIHIRHNGADRIRTRLKRGGFITLDLPERILAGMAEAVAAKEESR